MDDSFYNYSAVSVKGESIAMSSYKNKIILIVNTSNNCGLAKQYKGLEKLYQKYKDRGVVVLGFLCNQFVNIARHPNGLNKGHEPSIDKVTFPIFSPVHVSGEFIHPIFQFLSNSFEDKLGKDISWNFTKFLIDQKGIPIKRFDPIIKPDSIANDIDELLLLNHNVTMN